MSNNTYWGNVPHTLTVPLDVFDDIDEKVGSQDYALYTLAARAHRSDA